MAEYWDLLDANRRPLGKLHRRGDPLPEGSYHLVVQIWVRDDAGRFLISRRHPGKPWPLYWETTGGSVVAGEDSLTGARRELEEELGICVPAERMKPLGAITREQTIYDVYLVRWNGGLSELTLQDTEVVDAKWADYDELCAIDDRGEWVYSEGYFRTWFAPSIEPSGC